MNEIPVASACACGGQATEADLAKRLEGVLAEYREKPGALIPVLQIAQGIYGYLPEGVLKRIALALGKSYSEVAGVVGFYAFFSTHPRGKHVVRVCLGTACYVRGGKQVLETMKKELGIDVGETSKDGMFSLEIARCFGACGLAPAMCIDEEVYKRVRPAKIREILATYYAPTAKKPGAGKKAAPARSVAARAASRKKGTKVHA
jgi:NADH:ubiquinone oxidoreductase subunit E